MRCWLLFISMRKISLFFFLKKRNKTRIIISIVMINVDYNKQNEFLKKISLFISMTIIISFLKKEPWLVDLGFSFFTFPPPWPVLSRFALDGLLWFNHC
jgi:hypothetical protein